MPISEGVGDSRVGLKDTEICRLPKATEGQIIIRGDGKWENRLIWRVVSKSTDYTASNNDVVLVDASGGPKTITLPPVEVGARVDVKKVDDSANAVTVATPGDEKIDGATSLSITVQYESYTLICDGTNWYIITMSLTETNSILSDIRSKQFDTQNQLLLELKKMNRHLALMNDETISEEDIEK